MGVLKGVLNNINNNIVMGVSIAYKINNSSRYKNAEELAIIGTVSYTFFDATGNQKRQFRFSTKKKCPIGKLKAGRIHPSVADASHINTALQDFINKAETLYKEFERKKEFPQPEIFRSRLLGESISVEEARSMANDLDSYVAYQVNKGSSPYFIKSLKKAVERIKDFAKKHRYELDYSTINLTFYGKFKAYCKNEVVQPDSKIGLDDNTFGGYIKNLKCFMNFAKAEGWNKYDFYRHKEFKIISNHKSFAALTEDEVNDIFLFNLNLRKGLELTRDYFVLGCETGLRYSDYVKIKKRNIEEVVDGYNLKVTTQKTGAEVVIPLSQTALNILQKYDFQLMPPPSNQKMNENLKTIATMAGVDKLVTTHTARRTFATIAYFNELPVQWIMKITGHKTEKEFYKYIGVTLTENAAQIRKAMQGKYKTEKRGLLTARKLRVA